MCFYFMFALILEVHDATCDTRKLKCLLFFFDDRPSEVNFIFRRGAVRSLFFLDGEPSGVNFGWTDASVRVRPSMSVRSRPPASVRVRPSASSISNPRYLNLDSDWNFEFQCYFDPGGLAPPGPHMGPQGGGGAVPKGWRGPLLCFCQRSVVSFMVL